MTELEVKTDQGLVPYEKFLKSDLKKVGCAHRYALLEERKITKHLRSEIKSLQSRLKQRNAAILSQRKELASVKKAARELNELIKELRDS
jgi:uncharacterized protein YydD (DUF2326 family)